MRMLWYTRLHIYVCPFECVHIHSHDEVQKVWLCHPALTHRFVVLLLCGASATDDMRHQPWPAAWSCKAKGAAQCAQ